MHLFSIALVLMVVACKTGNTESTDLQGAPPLAERPLLMVANVENAFDGIDQGTEYPEYSSKTSNWNATSAQNKAARVAEVFLAANCPEIVVSPEVENQNAADLIANAASKCNYKAISANDKQDFPIGVAIFTSRAVSNVSKIETGYRPHLRIDFADGLTVIGVHFKSQRDGGDDLRLKAAAALKSQIPSITSQKLIIAGDFNTEEDLLAGTKVKNCTSDAPPTHVYRGEWHRLDKIYAVNCGVVGRLSTSFLMRNGVPYRSEYYKNGNMTVHSNKGYSDHMPLYMLN